MLELLGDVDGLNILDVGNGYLCRKLARAGASMTGVELSDEFCRIATERESEEPLGIDYHNHSAADLSSLGDATFDKAVSNYGCNFHFTLPFSGLLWAWFAAGASSRKHPIASIAPGLAG